MSARCHVDSVLTDANAAIAGSARDLRWKTMVNGKAHRKRGFTLLEVLIALIFFSLIGLVLQDVTASTVHQYQSVKLKMYATWLAENKLSELRLSEGLPAAREYKEDVEFGDMEWQLISKVSTTDNPDIHRVEVESYHINDQNNEKTKRITLTGFVGRY